MTDFLSEEFRPSNAVLREQSATLGGASGNEFDRASVNDYTVGAVGDLESLRQSAADLQEMSRAIAGAAPEYAEGTDHTGAVLVIVGSDGLPESIRVNAQWQERIHPESFGAAVTEAAQQAMLRRAEAWSRSYEQSSQKADSGSYGSLPEQRQVPHPSQVRDPEDSEEPIVPRPLDEIAEDVIEMLDCAISASGSEAVPEQGRGSDSNNRVVITLMRSGQMSCSANVQWIAKQGSTQLNQTLSAALAAARQGLQNQKAGNAVSAERASRLIAESLAATRRAIDALP